MVTQQQEDAIMVDVLYDALTEAAERLEEAASIMKACQMLRSSEHIAKAADAARDVLDEYAGTPDEPEDKEDVPENENSIATS